MFWQGLCFWDSLQGHHSRWMGIDLMVRKGCDVSTCMFLVFVGHRVICISVKFMHLTDDYLVLTLWMIKKNSYLIMLRTSRLMFYFDIMVDVKLSAYWFISRTSSLVSRTYRLMFCFVLTSWSIKSLVHTGSCRKHLV